jgi:CheY-like chemotaxis protein
MYRIAVLDDDKHWCLALQRFLEKTFDVSTFNDANSLIESLIQNVRQYDLIMVDLSLPPNAYGQIDGRKFIRYIRDILIEPPILVLVTAFIGKNELSTGEIICKEADAFLAKDAGLDEILRQLEQLLVNRNES